ncbi:MAG: MBL fold metallo-hydrolase [Nitrososphaerota archaeon]
MVSITPYGGVGEVGGNKLLLEDRGVRIWMDFGEPFDYGSMYFIGWLQPRKIAGCKDHFEFGLLPRLKGLYREDLLRGTDLEYTSPRFHAVFLSHAHFDHMAHIAFIDEKIPVYLGEATKTIIEAHETTSDLDYGPHEYITFRTGKRIKVDHVLVEPVHVDHSIPAAYGLILYTSKGAVVYTGDIRIHGPMARMTLDFLKRARSADPVCIICEGTRVTPSERRKYYSEKEVLDGVSNVCKRSGLVIATSYSRDVDRLKTFYEAARRSGRTFVVQTRTAYLLSQLQRHMKVPELTKGGEIKIYFKRKKSGSYDDKDYYEWERPFLDYMIKAEEIQKNQDKILLHLSFYDFAELIDIKPRRGSSFIHSMSEPYTEEDVEYEVMMNWLKHFGLRFYQLHASGHASQEDIKKILKSIGAKKTIPIHTDHPELFKKLTKYEVIVPKLSHQIPL